MAGIGAGRRVFVLGWAAAMLLGLGRWAGAAEFQVVDKFSVNGSALFKSSTTWQGVSAPPLPPSGSGALYFDSGSGTFKISEAGGAYVGLFGGFWSRASGLITPSTITDKLALGRSDLTGAALLVSTNSTATPALYVEAATGFVGHGTASPSTVLHTKTALSDGLRVENTVNGNGVNIRFDGPDSGGTARNAFVSFIPAAGTNQSRLSFSNPTTELLSARLDGNIGVGTTAPAAKLDVAGSIRRTGSFYPALWREEVISSDARSGNTVLSQLSQNYVMNAESNNSGSQFRWYNAGGTAIGSVDLTALSPSMALTSGAYLGISTSSPIGQLELVEANSTADRQRLVLTNTQPGGYGSALLWRGQQNFVGGGLRDAAKILVDGSGNWSSEGTSSSSMSIFLGSGGTLNKVMELQPVGNVGIGTATFSRPGLAVATGEGLSLQRETQGQRKVVSWSRANSIKWDLGMEGDGLTDHFYLIDRPSSATRLLIESGTGRVGIGTTNPGAALDVVGGAEFDDALGLRGSSPNVDLEDTDASTRDYRIEVDGSSLTITRYDITSTPDLAITGAGLVGIGTTNPAQKLEVAGTVRATAFEGSGANLTGISAAQLSGSPTFSTVTVTGSAFSVGSSTLVVSAGRVGIGNTAPAVLLHLGTGSPGAAGGIQFGDTATDNIHRDPSYGGVMTDGNFRVASSSLRIEPNDATLRLYSDISLARNASGLLTMTAPNNFVIPSGNVGIGTTGPGSLLHVLQDSSGGAAGLKLTGSAVASGTGKYAGLLLGQAPSSGGGVYLTVGSSDFGAPAYFAHQSAATIGATGGFPLYLRAGGDDSGGISINASGNVGVGTTAPGARLEVRVEDGDASGVADVLKLTHTTSGSAGGGIGAGLVFASKEDTGIIAQHAAIRSINEEAHIGDDVLAFYTTSPNSSGLQEAMRLRYGAGGTTFRLGPSTTSPYAYGGDAVITKNYPYGAVMVLQSDYDEASDLDMLAIRNAKAASSSYTFLRAVSDADGTPRTEFVVRGNGNVGIGQDDSGSTTKLWVQGNSSSDYHLRVSSQSGTGGLLVVDKSGGVGVGTTSPLYRAQVLHDDGVASAEHVVLQVGKTSGGVGALNFGYIADGSGVTAAHIKAVAGTRLAIGTNTGSQALSIVDSGAVGVGTTAPGDFAKFEVVTTGTRAAYFAGPSGGHGILVRAGSGDTQNAALIQDASGATTFMAVRADNRTGIGIASPSARLEVASDLAPTARVLFVSSQNAAGMFVVRGDGKVGLGTTAPAELLTLSGGSLATDNSQGLKIGGPLVYTSNGTYAYVKSPSGSAGAGFRVQNNAGSADVFTVLDTGNVGIGTTAPSEKLHVVDGSIKISTTSGSAGIVFQDGTTQTTAGKVLQVVHRQNYPVVSGSASIPFDSSIPQNTEGFEVMTASITPIASTSRLLVEAGVQVWDGGTTEQVEACLFRDTTADALTVAASAQVTAGGGNFMTIRYEAAANATSLTTFKIRVGGNGSTIYFNDRAGASIFGGRVNSYMSITEISQ